MAEDGVQQWVDEFTRATNENEELQAHGKYYSCNFMLDMEEHRFIVRMHEGKVEEILVDPSDLDARYQFIVRASADTWRNFGQETPEPMYHGIWAASFRRDMRLEGDLLVMMQNLRTFTRHLELLRGTGVPV
jgi:hypothetical protein